jgi:hypothetical protein
MTCRLAIRSNEVNVKKERLTQIVLVIVGLMNVALTQNPKTPPL